MFLVEVLTSLQTRIRIHVRKKLKSIQKKKTYKYTMRNPLFDEQVGLSIISYFLICVFGFYLMGGNADPTWGFAPMAVARIGADFFESTILMDTMALVVVRMGGERRFASLLRICDPVDDVDCWE